MIFSYSPAGACAQAGPSSAFRALEQAEVFGATQSEVPPPLLSSLCGDHSCGQHSSRRDSHRVQMASSVGSVGTLENETNQRGESEAGLAGTRIDGTPKVLQLSGAREAGSLRGAAGGEDQLVRGPTV